MSAFVFQQAPFVRIIIPFVLGMIFLPIGFETGLLLCLLLLIPTLCYRFIVRSVSLSWRLRKLPGWLFFLAWLCLGAALFQGQRQERSCPRVGDYMLTARVKIISSPQVKPNSLQCMVKVVLSEPACWQNKRCVLYLTKDTLAGDLRAGDHIMVYANMKPFSPQGLSLDFNYEQYLLNKGFCAGSFVHSRAWRFIGRSNNYRARSDEFRNNIIGRFKQAGLSEASLALVSALVLGRKDLMEAEQKQYFASSGVAHMLAVSGMHVSILFLVLDKLLFFIKPRRGGLWCKQFISISLLWAYAFVTGLSPSVLRAVMMCSVLCLGRCLRRPANTWNTLCLAAFVMLILNPSYLLDAGFQLSYVAVASILLLLPQAGMYLGLVPDKNLSEKRIGIKDKIIDLYRDIFLLSLVAQIGTAPLSIYYFHQFPRYFLLGNLLLAPCAVLLFYLCLAFMTLSWLPFFGTVLMPVINLLAGFFCQTAAFIERLPASVFNELWPARTDVIICYLLLALQFYLFKNKRYIYALNRFLSTLYKLFSS